MSDTDTLRLLADLVIRLLPTWHPQDGATDTVRLTWDPETGNPTGLTGNDRHAYSLAWQVLLDGDHE